MKGGSMTPQEIAGIHEVLFFKNTGAVKANTFAQLAVDEKLRKLLEQDTAATKQQLQDILNVLKSTKTLE